MVDKHLNALELADKLDFGHYDWADLASAMLRSQAEEINNLKQWQNRMLDVIKNLESQVYGGTTK